VSYEEITYEKLGRVGRITLNRPDVYNAQSREMRDEMDLAFAEAVADDDVRVIILAGAGRNFSTGHDVGRERVAAYKANPPTPGQRTGTSWQYNVENSLRWRDVPKPTIASVQGYCIFGGWIVASAMDLIVASDDALFLPGYVQYFGAPWDLGIRKAKEILFKSRFITAEEAHQAGFVSQVVPRDDLEQATMEFAEEIAESDPLVLRMTKLAINNAQDAMGYRSSIEGAHAGHIVLALAGKMTPLDGKSRLPGVDQAVTKLRRAQGKE
jgi:enoyl-CoA hydratase